MTLKATFGKTPHARKVETELLSIMDVLQDVTLRLHEVSFELPFEDTKGHLQGYADVINSISGNISELFEFYK